MCKALILSLRLWTLALRIALGPAVSATLAESAPEPRGVKLPRPETQATGKTYALLIGISHYNPPFTALQFADKDAEKFAELLKQPLGGSLKGGLQQDEIVLLTNGQATRAGIDDAVKKIVAEHASRANTLVLFVAAHGVDLRTEVNPFTYRVVEHEPYIVTYNGNSQDLKTTSYKMGELRRLVAEQAEAFGHVFVFVDVCHAANVAGIAGLNGQEDEVHRAFTSSVDKLGILMASHAHKYAYESANFGGGHGAFSYFLISGLSGLAASPGATSITWARLNHYVSGKVFDFTSGAQETDEKDTDPDMVIVDTVVDNAAREAVTKALDLGDAKPITAGEIRDLRRRYAVSYAKASIPPASPARVSAGADAFEQALNRGSLLPEDPGSAAHLLAQMRRDPNQPQAALQESERRLHVALDDRGQEIMSRYLEGEQAPQVKGDFERCARYFEEARTLAVDSSFDQSRALFCQGRALIFGAHDTQYDTAEALLKESIRIDPKRAYAFNALGISELERSASIGRGLDSAASAFRTAIRYAPYWAYPVHNLALLESERGNYDEAIRLYAHAMSIAPLYSYLPYNLGLLYERLGDFDNAQVWFDYAFEVTRKAGAPGSSTWPERSVIWNAMGTLARSQGREGKAIEQFRKALHDNPDNADARHNLALLLAKRGEFAEADKLWRSNMDLTPKFLPSWISHAESLAARGDTQGAVCEYEQVLLPTERPDYVGARQAVAQLFIEKGDAEEALCDLEVALRLSPSNATLLEMRGDAYTLLRVGDAARADWNEALKMAGGRAAKARLKRKLHGLAGQRTGGRFADHAD